MAWIAADGKNSLNKQDLMSVQGVSRRELTVREFMGEGRSHQEDAEISCCPGVGTTKADTFTLFNETRNPTCSK